MGAVMMLRGSLNALAEAQRRMEARFPDTDDVQAETSGDDDEGSSA
jgi:hypothetical protein